MGRITPGKEIGESGKGNRQKNGQNAQKEGGIPFPPGEAVTDFDLSRDDRSVMAGIFFRDADRLSIFRSKVSGEVIRLALFASVFEGKGIGKVDEFDGI